MNGKIIQEKKPFGVQTKADGGTYGPAGQYVVQLESGEQVTTLLWNVARAVGDPVQLEKSGEFWNEPKKNRRGAAPSVDEGTLGVLVNMLKSMDKKIDQLLGLGSSTSAEEAHAKAEAARDAERMKQNQSTPPITEEFGDYGGY